VKHSFKRSPERALAHMRVHPRRNFIMRLVSALVIAAAITLAPACSPSLKASAETPAAAIGPAIGAATPAVTLTSTNGSPQTLGALAGEKGTAIAFVRSADWCPFCKKQLVDLNAAAAPLAEAGWTLIAVSYDDAETLGAFHTEKQLAYPLFSDPDSAAIKAFGLLNTDMKEGTRFYGVPHPAIIFAGKDGTVKGVLREEGYKDRPANEAVIAAAKGF
jgi:peroxiredoxin